VHWMPSEFKNSLKRLIFCMLRKIRQNLLKYIHVIVSEVFSVTKVPLTR
jgi:hypothetical protein